MDKLDNYIVTILEKSITPRKLPFLHTVLAGRRTGQAVQDIHLFQMQHLFGLVPNLKANYLEKRLLELVHQGSIISTENGYVTQGQLVATFENDYPNFQGFTFQRQAFAFFPICDSQFKLLVTFIIMKAIIYQLFVIRKPNNLLSIG